MKKKPIAKGDTTQTRRQSHRRAKLDQLARAAGYSSWSAFETAVINGLSWVPKQEGNVTKQN